MSYRDHFAEYTHPSQYSFAAALAGDGSMPAVTTTGTTYPRFPLQDGTRDMNYFFDNSSTDVDQTRCSYPDLESLGVPPNIAVRFIMYIY